MTSASKPDLDLLLASFGKGENQGSDLTGLNLKGRKLKSLQLWEVELSGAELSGCTLYGCKFRDTILEGSTLKKAFFDPSSGKITKIEQEAGVPTASS